MSRSGDATRLALIEAATSLFARDGVDGPTIEAIVRTAGAKNASAVNYHFGSRGDLLAAVLNHHRGPIDAQRRQLLSGREATEPTLEFLAEVTIDPLVDHLAEPLGAEYLRIRAELLSRDLETQIDDAPLIVAAAGSFHVRSDDSGDRHRRELVTILVFGGLAEFARRHPDAPEQERRDYGAFLRAAMVAVSRVAQASSPA